MKILIPVLLTLTCGTAFAASPDSDCQPRYTLRKDGTVVMVHGHPKLDGYYTYSTDKNGKPKWKACKPPKH
jgi:hypothetical protein